jgi:predicted NBD/HSP70 family sugar kinase
MWSAEDVIDDHGSHDSVADLATVRVVTRADSPVEHLHVRRHNLSLVLRLLATQGPRSRAGVAAVTGLTRATVSSLVADLIDRGLVKEVGPKSDQRLGRPATLLQLDGSGVVTLGLELEVGFTAVLANDLAGDTVYQRRRALSGASTAFDDLLPILVKELRRAVDAVEEGGRRVAGVTVAVPGITDVGRGVVVLAPNLGWRDVPLRERLVEGLGREMPIELDNEANLGALAEFRKGALAGTPHLVYVLAVKGVGAGVIIDGSVFRGATGAAAEVGHTTVQPRGLPCACGSTGCWETTVGLRALLFDAVPDLAANLLRDRRLSPEGKVAPVVSRARANNPIALKGLKKFGRWLGIGLANIVDSFNPQVIVLAGFLPDVAPWVMPEAMAALEANALPESLLHCRVELTTLGFTAGALGCTIHASERLFTDPTLVPTA